MVQVSPQRRPRRDNFEGPISISRQLANEPCSLGPVGYDGPGKRADKCGKSGGEYLVLYVCFSHLAVAPIEGQNKARESDQVLSTTEAM